MTPKAIRHLKRRDKRLAKVISNVGKMSLKIQSDQSPFEALVEAIVYQQLHGKAAATILKRVIALFPRRKFPKPEDFLKIETEKLRQAGLSGAKAAAIKDLSQKTIDGLIPSAREIQRLTDDEIIERLTTVKGIGRWTVQMLLIFKLGRPDILPATDFAIRKAVQNLLQQNKMPTPTAVLEYGETWKPHRTTAAWYLWRSLDKK